MPSTTHGLPYPPLTGVTVNVPRDIQALADALEVCIFTPGDLKATACSSAPTGWLLCDGAAVSRTTYAGLFTAISTTYGAGNGTTTFNLPDLRGRVPVGVDGVAARLAANDALGNSGGEEKHTLTPPEQPNHTHGVSPNQGATGAADGYVLGQRMNAASELITGKVSTTGVGTPGTGTTFVPAALTDQPHNNMQPFQVVNWIVKT